MEDGSKEKAAVPKDRESLLALALARGVRLAKRIKPEQGEAAAPSSDQAPSRRKVPPAKK